MGLRRGALPDHAEARRLEKCPHARPVLFTRGGICGISIPGSVSSWRRAVGRRQIARLLRQSTSRLIWSQNTSYSEEKLGRRFLDNYVTGILTGPEGNLAREAPCSGFVLLGPETEYPEHCHGPREVYLVVTPGGEWCLDGTDWFSVRPGQVIHHAPWQSHAMRTSREPMLAFAAWLDQGDRRAITI